MHRFLILHNPPKTNTMKTTQQLALALTCTGMLLLAACGSGTQPTTMETTTLSADSTKPEADSTGGMTGDCSSDPCGPCDNAARYPTMDAGGGAEISPDHGRGYVQTFHDAHKTMFKGGYISKIALDSLFCNHKDYSGVYCYVAIDAAGKEVIVIEGVPSDANAVNPVRVDFDKSIPAEDRYKVFVTQSMCPTMCGYCGL
jgi:hypothetical protein